MKHFTDSVGGLTLEEEREELRLDMKHLQEQCDRYGCSDDPIDAGGVGSVLFRQRARLMQIYNTM